MSTKSVWVCPYCGSSDIQRAAWLWVNTNVECSGSPPRDEMYCDDCLQEFDDPQEQIEQVDDSAPPATLRGALTWLLDDLADSGDDCHPETGVMYDSAAFAHKALKDNPE